MMRYIHILAVLFSTIVFGQDKLKGKITQENNISAEGASVYWLNTQVGTTTDLQGNFEVPYKSTYKKLVISYVGYNTDTISISSNTVISHTLKVSNEIDEVVVRARNKAMSISLRSAENVINVSSAELLKAACCNLSESFETNPSIDVNFADAVTGTRQIKMLGLTSPYILIAIENIPSIRGASQAFGLSFTPGTWVESIQITKGSGSVVNGFESIAGQINAELKKPTTDDKFFVNLYGAANGRLEMNTHINTKLSDKWSTGFYLHGNTRDQKIDNNNDNFLDMPLAKQINLMNRWQYTNLEKGFVSFINLKYLTDDKQAGEINFNPESDKLMTNVWGSEIKTRRFDVSTKLGYVNPELPYKSVGLQLAYSNHNQDSYYGLNSYDIQQKSMYANVIYNTIIGDSRSKVKTGLNYTNDTYKEYMNLMDYSRNENSVGAFFEYSFENLTNLNLIAGLRVDSHNLLGTFITPRFHIRYTPWEKSAIKASFGRGKRAANIFSENQNLFASSRNFIIHDANGEIYGLDPEIAWNYGISFSQKFKFFNKKAELTFDYYKTDFENKVVIDLENSREVNFYNLKGKSFANSFQAELSYQPVKRLDLRFAYKYYDVKTQYNSGLLEKSLTPKHRFFANASYETKRKEGKHSHWKFDTTLNWLGKQRFTNTDGNAVQNQLPNYTPTLSTLNAQVTKIFSRKFEVYLGAENITNTKQNNPIVSADNPFGSDFDANFVYGPIFGTSYYAGLRFKIK